MMFALPGILSQSKNEGSVLLWSFHDGSIIDAKYPSRAITLNGNASVGYPYKYGGKFANTSLIFNNRSTGNGLQTTDMTNLGNFGGSGVDYTIEFWCSNPVTNNPASIRLLSGVTVIFRFLVDGNTGISVTFHNQIASFTNANYPIRAAWAHYAFVRTGNAVASYRNGVLNTPLTTTTQINVPITEIQLGFATSVPASNSSYTDTNINYFAITLGSKYTANFDPVSGTGFSYPNLTTEYCV